MLFETRRLSHRPWPCRAREAAVLPPSEAEVQAARESADQRRALSLRESKVAAGGYLADGMFLAIFTWIGTVHWSAIALYTLPGWIVCAVACKAISSGHSRHWRDPAVSDAQSLAGMAICGLGIVVYPAMTFLYVLILFTIFLRTTYRMSRVHIHLAWFGMSVLIGVASLRGDRSFQVPHASTAEQVVAWACFSLTLARCALLSLINSSHKMVLSERGQQMADTRAQIERLANFDELTGLPNRRNLLRRLDQELAQSHHGGTPLAVAILDLDHFRAINDTRGHLVGDHTLQAFTAAVQAHRRGTDALGRYGGGKFLLILPGAGMDHAGQALERVRIGVATVDWNAVSPGLHVTFSAGITTLQAGETAEQLLSRADHALHDAKHERHDGFRVG